MINLDEFSNDEQIMLSTLIGIDLLTDKVAEFRGVSEQQIRLELQSAAAKILRSITTEAAKNYLQSHRDGMEEAIRLAGLQQNAAHN